MLPELQSWAERQSLAAAMSSFPSPLKSPTAMERSPEAGPPLRIPG